ncbi:MAG: YbaY family lipoprotein [Pseudomonadota bacterium]|jgi:putative lipoprotein
MPMMIRPAVVAALLISSALAVTSPAEAESSLRAGRLTGTVSIRERIALPRDAVVEVSLVDVARQDAPSRRIARTRIVTRGRQPPLPFVLNYPADRGRGHADYAVQARIESRGQLLFITDTRAAPPPEGRLDLLLVRASR